MEYRVFDDAVVVRLDPDDEICGCLLTIAEKEDIELAEIQGLGALKQFTVGVFDLAEQVFRPNSFKGAYEIVSLVGTLTRKDGKPYLHLHLSAGDTTGAVVGGHLSEAYISATGEIVMRKIKGHVGRKFNEITGLYQFSFDE